MRFRCTYQQHAVAECTFTIDVPMEVVVQGDAAVKAWCDEHENDSGTNADADVIDWLDRVHGQFEVEKL